VKKYDLELYKGRYFLSGVSAKHKKPQAQPNVVGSLVKPHDRFKNAALFLCGYLKYSEDKVDDVASQIRRYAALNEPYELCIGCILHHHLHKNLILQLHYTFDK